MLGNIVRGIHRGKPLGRSVMRGSLTSKQGNKNFYKGKGVRKVGKFIDHRGNFKIDNKLIPEIVVPDLTGFPLKPYVSYATPMIKVAPPTMPKLDLDSIEVPLDLILRPRSYKRELRAAEAKKARDELKAAKKQQQLARRSNRRAKQQRKAEQEAKYQKPTVEQPTIL